MNDLLDMNNWNLNPNHICINMENFQFIWLDEHLNTSNSLLNVKYYQKLIVKLNNSIQFFTESLKCINFMKIIKQEKLILIISGSLADQVLENIHSYTPLSTVFIVCSNRDSYKNLLIKYKKILGIFVNQDDLFKSIEETIHKIEKQIFNLIIFDSNNNLSKPYLTFLWPQLLFNVIRNLPVNKDEKTKFSKICKDYYQNNLIEIQNIEDFNLTYQSDQSIEWYRKKSFLYKIINKALCTDNIQLLCSFPFIIHDLCYQLEIEKQKFIENDLLIFYRGMIIPDIQTKYYENIQGKLILIKGFSFVTRTRDSMSPVLSDNEVGVLFKINVNPNDNILFADIANEKEVLFGPNIVFYVDLVNFDQTNRCLNINMTVKDVFDDYLWKYVCLEQEETRNCQPFAYLGRLLFVKFGEIEYAEKYFEIILKKLPSNHNTIPIIYCQLGDLNLLQKNSNTALDYYKKAIKYYRQYSTDYTDNVDCLLKIGNAYITQEYNDINKLHPEIQFDSTVGIAALTYRTRLDNTQQTLNIGKQAMEILDMISQEDLARRAKVHQMMGKTYLVRDKILRDEGKIYLALMEINKADKHLQAAFTIFQDIVPLENAYLVSILTDLSNFHNANGNFFMARKLLRKQLLMAEKCLPFDHPKQREYLENFIHLYKSHDLKNVAMKVASKKLKKYETNFGKIHSIIAQILMTMGYYDKACHILFTIEPIDEYNITLCLNQLLHRKHLNQRNIQLFQNWLDYLTQNYPTTERRIADVLCQFANIYNDMGKFDIAFTYLHQSLPIYRHHQDHVNLRTVEDFMRHIERRTGRLHIENVICDDNWENGLRFQSKSNDTRTLSVPSVRQQIRPTNSQIRSSLLNT